MRIASATDYAMVLATKAGTLRITERPSRFGGFCYAIEDDRGLIEVHLTRAEAEARTRAAA